MISTITASEKKLYIFNKHCENIMGCRRKFVYIHTYICMCTEVEFATEQNYQKGLYTHVCYR